MKLASDVDAAKSCALVLLLTALVPAVIAEARVEVPVLIADPRDELAVCTSERVASDPVVSPAPVRVRVAALQISEATALNEERVREVYN
jgi:hypothetical protein